MTKYIFITGGVVSSLGKGLASAALGALLQARGLRIRLRKLDPYLNVDPGTMSPYQHGEVYVTEDGAETDLDLGHYERFTGVAAEQSDNITTGRIYRDLLEKERIGAFLGETVQIIPHVTDAIKKFITRDSGDYDVILCEIGGTVGDIEALPFFEAIRQLGHNKRGDCLYIHLTLLPYLASAGELKTKPTQHSVKELRAIGIQPDILLCRTSHPIEQQAREKMALFCNLATKAVIPALDVDTIYRVPLAYHEAGLDSLVMRCLGLAGQKPDLANWRNIVAHIKAPEGEVNITIIGKYTGLPDAYKSLLEALTHGGIVNRVLVNCQWLEAEQLEQEKQTEILAQSHGILVPGGFGARGVEGKISAIEFARTQKIPFFGICYGMQLAVIEALRNVAGIKRAGSSEFAENCDPVVGLLEEWHRGEEKIAGMKNGALGGTMRLGAYPAVLHQGSKIARIYGEEKISERHRHRYEVNPAYRGELEQAGLVFSAFSPDGFLPEAIEMEDHPWFIGVQFHPELKSRPTNPHPLFCSFIAAAVKQGRLV